mgnify:CR=1 FL=1
MPGIYYGPYGAHNSTFAEPTGGNTGPYPAGHSLILPDGRVYRMCMNDGTAEVAGNLYTASALTANHKGVVVDTARAVGATVISATLGATLAAIDTYAEGYVHPNLTPGIGYNYRIQRAYAAGDAHAAAAASAVLTVNLAPGDTVQVALTTSTEVTFNYNRFKGTGVIIHGSPPVAALAGVSPGVAAANRWYWTQVQGMAGVLVQGTLVIGDFCVPSATVDGAVMPSAAFETDGPYVGIVDDIRADGEYGLVDLKIM